MFRAIATAILFVPALFLPVAAQDTELTVDQIVQKHTEALGGLDKLKAIQSMKASGKAVLMGGQMEAPVILQLKRPNSMRMDMTMQGKSFIHAFDGTTAWNINPFMGATEPQKANDEDTKTARDDADFLEGSLVDYKTKGNVVELMGKEDVEGSSAYKLKVTKKSGTIEYQYLDAQTFLPIKTSGKRKQAGQEFEVESYPSNFKAVQGVMMPFGLNQKMNGKPLMQLSVENVEVNLVMDDAIFRMPEKPKEEKPKPEKPKDGKK